MFTSATLAQLVERYTRNVKVPGPIPGGGSKKKKRGADFVRAPRAIQEGSCGTHLGIRSTIPFFRVCVDSPRVCRVRNLRSFSQTWLMAQCILSLRIPVFARRLCAIGSGENYYLYRVVRAVASPL
jgi:hypothetical protein